MRLVENIVKEIDNLPRGPFWVRDVMVEKRYSFPITLNVGNGREIHIRPEINRMFATLSKAMMEEYFGSYKSDFTDSEWNRMVKKAIGMALVDDNRNIVVKSDSKAILQAANKKIHDWICDIQEREYAFGCHFCNVPDLEPLSIGPVLFEPRLTWLKRTHVGGNVSTISRSRLERAWKGERVRKRKAFEDEMRENEILDTIGKCGFVCSVKIALTGSEAGLHKALTAARLATTAIALAWDRPSSVLDVMALTFDREPYRHKNLVFFPNNRFGYRTSWSYISGGVTWLQRNEWDNLATEFNAIFQCAGEVITYVTGGRDAVSRPELLNVLFQAFLWFHEGSREQVDAMAIVKFCAAMDALSCGREKRGILNLVRSRLVIKDEVKFVKDLNRIYGDGRSRTVHGTSDKLQHDWSEGRDVAQHLARLCLVSCLQWASESPQLDDPRRFSEHK